MSTGFLKDYLEIYLQEKSLAWSPTTIKTERAAISPLLPHLDGNAISLWNVLYSSQKPYTVTVTWGRIVRFYDYVVSKQGLSNPNPYKLFRKQNARLFKNSYVRKELKMTYEDAKEAINRIHDDSIKAKALHLLKNGLRYTESGTEQDGLITGKGGKVRKVMLPGKVDCDVSYSTFWRALKDVGLTPHMLRKLAATRFVELGMKEADLLKVFGWESFETAKIYLQPKRDEELTEIMKSA